MNYVRGLPSLDKGDMLNKLKGLGETIDVPPRCTPVLNLKKYDIVYVETFGIGPHYVLVHRVTEDSIYGVVLTSKTRVHTMCPLEGDRVLQGGFATNTYMCFELETCKNLFVRVYESKREADKIFRKLKAFYKESFNL